MQFLIPMKPYRSYLLPSLALAALVPYARAEKEVVVRRDEANSPQHFVVRVGDDKLEKVTYLGVNTAPVSRTLGAQLGLPGGVGLEVIEVMEKSPAAAVLKDDDVLIRFDDQEVINLPQLGVLVRTKKEGDEVKLTIVRGGKEMTVKTKLAVHEVPTQANASFFHNGEFGAWGGTGPDLATLRELPGMGTDDARDVLRMIGRERRNFVTGPRMHVIGRAGNGSTILDLPKSNIAYSDDDGAIEIKVDDGRRTLTVKNAKGGVIFDGPINTEEERKKLPAEVSKRLRKIETDTFSFEIGDDFKPEVVPLPPEPAKTKIRQLLDRVHPERTGSQPF